MNLAVLGSVLSEKGYESDQVNSGAKGLELVEERYELAVRGEARMYDLLLVDYSMPEMDGPQVARSLRGLFDKTDEGVVRQPFICCCTAYTEASFM